MTTATTPLEDLVAALESARREVFRFEGHQDYPDDALWQAYCRGEDWAADPELADWCALVSDTVGRKVSWVRARRVLSPWSPYTAWEIGEHFPHNLDAGEDIRLVPGSASGEWPADFWLIDDAAWRLDYGPDAAMVVAAIDPGEVWKARAWRDHALALASPLRVGSSA